MHQVTYTNTIIIIIQTSAGIFLDCFAPYKTKSIRPVGWQKCPEMTIGTLT